MQLHIGNKFHACICIIVFRRKKCKLESFCTVFGTLEKGFYNEIEKVPKCFLRSFRTFNGTFKEEIRAKNNLLLKEGEKSSEQNGAKIMKIG